MPLGNSERAWTYQEYVKKYDKLQAENEQLKRCILIRHKEGYIEGLTAYAWWKDGVQYVGTCGTTLKEAIEEALKVGE